MSTLAIETGSSGRLLALVGRRDTEATRASLAAVELTLSRGEMPPLHVHDEDEVFHVLDGSMLLYTGQAVVHLRAGQAYVAPKGIPHTYRADSERVRYATMTYASSVSWYEQFLWAVATPADEPDREAEDEVVVETLARANDITVLGPPGTLP